MDETDQYIESRETVINEKGAAAEATLSICLGQVGKGGPDTQPSSDANNWLCLIRKPLGNCSHHSPSSLGWTVCVQLVKVLITSTQPYWVHPIEEPKQSCLQSRAELECWGERTEKQVLWDQEKQSSPRVCALSSPQGHVPTGQCPFIQ